MRPHRSRTLHVLAVAVLLTACAVRPPVRDVSGQAPPAASPPTPAPKAAEAEVGAAALAVTGLTVPTEVAKLSIPTQVAGLADPVAPRTRTPAPDPRMASLAAQIDALLQERPGAYGVAVEWVPTHQRASHDAEREFESASVYKIGVAYAVLNQVDRGQFDLADRLSITADDATEVEPDGGLAPDDEVSVWDALQAMMGVSSNSAAHALMRLVGRAEINTALHALGLQATRVPEDDDQGAAVTTASDMANLLDLLADDRLLTPASRQSLRALLALPKDLDPLTACLPDGTEVLAKPGNQERASNIAGLVSTPEGGLIISVFDADVDPGDARATIQAITQVAWDVYAPAPAE